MTMQDTTFLERKLRAAKAELHMLSAAWKSRKSVRRMDGEKSAIQLENEAEFIREMQDLFELVKPRMRDAEARTETQFLRLSEDIKALKARLDKDAEPRDPFTRKRTSEAMDLVKLEETKAKVARFEARTYQIRHLNAIARHSVIESALKAEVLGLKRKIRKLVFENDALDAHLMDVLVKKKT